MKKKATQFSPEAFQGLGILIHEVVREELAPLEERLSNKIDQHLKTVDAYINKTTSWHEEQIILGARVDKISNVMIKKHLASGKELAI